MPDFNTDALSGDHFEASVRQVARQLFQGSHATGAIKLDGRERDEVIDTGTELIIVEATRSRKLDKAEYDLKKSVALVRALKATNQFSDYNFRIMLVTLDDPTADQNHYVRAHKAGCPKEIISFAALFSRLFDSRQYIRLRGDHSFGSIRNPADDSDLNVPPSSYIPTALNNTATGEALKAAQLAELMHNGGQFVLFGDYGSGKSMTLRDIYFRLRDDFAAGKSIRCPIYLNLREHIAQTQPDEALYRHAEKIGFPNAHSLISAWRAGFVVLFLDGFDELTPPQFAVSVANLKQARRFAVELVKRFIEQTPSDAPILVAGRESYFDSRVEAQSALGYAASATVFDLAGFSDAEIQLFLKKKKAAVPSWLPSRPLLLGYLANSGLLSPEEGLASLDPAAGWNQLLDKVCEREVKQVWGVGFEPSDLRLFIDGLSTCARRYVDGRGLQESDVHNVFRSIFGRDADEPANLLVRRLPGLGTVPGRTGAREFIDADFADAAASGDLRRFIEAPFTQGPSLENVVSPLGSLGQAMSVQNMPDAQQKMSVALGQASNSSELVATAVDLISILTDRQERYNGIPITVADGTISDLVLDPGVNLSRVTFKSCIIYRLELGRSNSTEEAKNYPKFQDCIIDRLEGVMSSNDVPSGVFQGNTTVEHYAAFAETNEAVMRSALPEPIKVLLTILRKLFLQRGTGRQYSALKRGLPPKSVAYVEPITALIKSHGFAEDITIDRRTILIPNRTKGADALSIMNGPNTSTDPLISEVRAL